MAASRGVRFAALWSANGDGLNGLIAGPQYVTRQWLDKLAPALEAQNLTVDLRDRAAAALAPHETRRAATDTGLPWTIVVSHKDLARELDGIAGRRVRWMTGLALLGVLVVGASYVGARSVARELAVARLQSDFVAAVSHEFRTPLTSLRQLTEILLDKRITNESRRETYYLALARQTDRLQRLVESLLDFGRMEAGTSPYRLMELDARELCASVVSQFRREYGERAERVQLATGDVSARVSVDRDAVTTALWNLLDNAVKYSPGDAPVTMALSQQARAVSIAVRDEGIGIPSGEQREIFRKFVRGTQAKAENIKGTGIGLAMVHYIAEAHGGTIAVDSEPGRGSTFTVTLPTCQES